MDDGVAPRTDTSPPGGGYETGAAASFAAVDLGASSGRVIVGTVADGRVVLTEVGRFANEPVPIARTRGGAAVLTWDTPALWRGILEGLRAAQVRFGPLAGIGIDSWAVDYGRIDASGALLGNPVCYRDSRTDSVLETVFERVSAQRQYAVNGLQIQPFTTAFQLLAEPSLDATERILLLPDLIGAWLTGVERCEVTNASTTGLLDARTRRWSPELFEGFGLPERIVAPLIRPGERLGDVRPEVCRLIGAGEGSGEGVGDGSGQSFGQGSGQGDPGVRIPVWAVGSHDTASAVVAVPLSTPDAAYISCGTWSLVGLELDEPVLTEASRLANVTNEAGVDGTVRYLKNVMGLWVLTETMRTWRAQGSEMALAEALLAAAGAEPLRTVVDIDDPRFLAPGDMPERLAQLAAERGQPVPETAGEVVRCILDSLALAYRRSVRQVAELAGRRIEVVHVVGGGANNDLLMRLTADATGLAVVTGPVEGAALGNVLVQARGAGVLAGGLADLRQVVAASTTLGRYEPEGGLAWEEAERRAFG